MPKKKPDNGGEAPPPQARGGRTSRHPNSLANLRRWPKGESGNPGGKSTALNDIMRLARSIAPEAIETLRAIMADPRVKVRDRVAAASCLLERGCGKPVTPIIANTAGLLSDGELGDGGGGDASALLRIVRIDAEKAILAKKESNGNLN